MKKALLYLLLFSYSAIVLKPVFPTIADTVAHIFWYSEHMATVHYEHGKYHVHYEYEQAAKNSQPDKDAALLKSAFASEHLILPDIQQPLPFTSVVKNAFSLFDSSIASVHLYGDYPPPKI